MKKITLVLICLLLVACSGHPLVLVTDGSYTGDTGVVFSGSLNHNPPDYTYYAGEGYGYPQIHPIGGIGGGAP